MRQTGWNNSADYRLDLPTGRQRPEPTTAAAVNGAAGSLRNVCWLRPAHRAANGGNVMRMLVRPAKREGTSRTIFHRPLIDGDVKSGTGGPVISIEAEGIYSDDSKYRYQIEITLGELEALIESSGPALGAGRPVSTGPKRQGHQEAGETSASILHLNRRSE